MRKSVFRVDVNNAKSKKAVLQAVYGVDGIESLSIDSEKKKLTVVGDVDPVEIVRKLRKRKLFRDIETVGSNEEKGDNAKSKQQQEKEQIIRYHCDDYCPNCGQPYYYYHPHTSTICYHFV